MSFLSDGPKGQPVFLMLAVKNREKPRKKIDAGRENAKNI